MENIERVIIAIKDIEKFLKEMSSIKGQSFDLDDPKIFHSLSMLSLAVINRAVDIGSDILIRKNVSMPSAYREIFVSLSREGVISRELSKNMEELVSHRNYLAHEYFGLDKKRLRLILNKINNVNEFVERVKKEIIKGVK